MMNRNKVTYILVGVVIAFASIAFLIGVVYPALADGTIYLPLISGNQANVDSAAKKPDNPQPTDAPIPGRKPGEPEGFIPTPVPEIPLPPGVQPVPPGVPAQGKPRPSREQLESMLPTPLPPDAPYRAGAIYDFVPVSSESVAWEAELIVIAKVHQIHPARWSTEDGKRPHNPHDRDNPAYIFTVISMKVEQVLAGDIKPNQILFIPQNGGQIGEESLTIDSPYPAFAEGQTWLLYLTSRNKRIIGMPDKGWRINDEYLIDPTTNLATNPFAQKTLAELIIEVDEVQKQKQER